MIARQETLGFSNNCFGLIAGHHQMADPGTAAAEELRFARRRQMVRPDARGSSGWFSALRVADRTAQAAPLAELDCSSPNLPFALWLETLPKQPLRGMYLAAMQGA